ncbi:antibiotic biosynthesis monooxygenase family protein [Saccharopolyspora sp. NPDC000995]
MATTIEPGAPVTTLINVFTVAPERQRELVELLDNATEEVMRHLPGFVSANIHAGLDGKHVANYAQWRSEDDFRAMLANPAAQEHMQAAAAVATYEPALYRVESSHHI